MSPDDKQHQPNSATATVSTVVGAGGIHRDLLPRDCGSRPCACRPERRRGCSGHCPTLPLSVTWRLHGWSTETSALPVNGSCPARSGARVCIGARQSYCSRSSRAPSCEWSHPARRITLLRNAYWGYRGGVAALLFDQRRSPTAVGRRPAYSGCVRGLPGRTDSHTGIVGEGTRCPPEATAAAARYVELVNGRGGLDGREHRACSLEG